MSIKIYRKNNFVVIDQENSSIKYLASHKADFDDVEGSGLVVWNVDNSKEVYSFIASELQNESGTFVGNKDDVLEYLSTNINFKTGVGSSTSTEVDIASIILSVGESIQGYYGLLTDFYFGGSATETVIDLNNVNTWVDVDIDISTDGVFDNRPLAMREFQAIGHDGDGSPNNPIVFKLEGLGQSSFANFRASISFEPEDDEGQLESRLLFNRHSGTTPSDDFSIEEVSLSMFNGADIDYVSEPMLSFFIGDTIDTNAVGDAGKCRFQIKSNVTGIIKLRALTWYINK